MIYRHSSEKDDPINTRKKKCLKVGLILAGILLILILLAGTIISICLLVIMTKTTTGKKKFLFHKNSFEYIETYKTFLLHKRRKKFSCLTLYFFSIVVILFKMNFF